jgi:hypothetical protein
VCVLLGVVLPPVFSITKIFLQLSNSLFLGVIKLLNSLKIILFGASLLLFQSCTSLPRLDIGSSASKQYVTEKVLAPGLTYYQVMVNEGVEKYSLVSEPMSDDESKIYVTRVTEVLKSQPGDRNKSEPNIALIGLVDFEDFNKNVWKIIRLESFNSLTEANSMKDYLSGNGIYLTVVNSASLAYSDGNSQISILKVNPQNYKGSLTSALANGVVQGTAPVSQIAAKATAAVNGGYFTVLDSQGTPGDPAGISVINGTLVSEAVLKRPALYIQNFPKLSFKILKNVSTTINLSLGNDTFVVDGLNRKLGYKFNCGYIDDSKVIQAEHDVVCRDNDEIVLFDEHFGDTSSVTKDQNFTFWIDEAGKVLLTDPNSIPNVIPSGQYLVVASGKKKKLLKQSANNNSSATVTIKIFDDGTEIETHVGTYLINGGPTLLHNREVTSNLWAIEGWSPSRSSTGIDSIDERDQILQGVSPVKNRLNFYDSWVNQRNPRTAVGIDENGILYVVVIYGRNPQKSNGASISEMANIMRSLGTVESLNLDGGGSSVMVVNGMLTGEPSDQNGERPVSESLIFTANQKD